MRSNRQVGCVPSLVQYSIHAKGLDLRGMAGYRAIPGATGDYQTCSQNDSLLLRLLLGGTWSISEGTWDILVGSHQPLVAAYQNVPSIQNIPESVQVLSV